MKLFASAILIAFILPNLARDTSNMPYADQIQREVPDVNPTDIYYPDGSLKEPYSTIAYIAMLEGMNAEIADMMVNYITHRSAAEHEDASRAARYMKDAFIPDLDTHNALVSTWFKNDISMMITLQREVYIDR